MKKFIWEKAEEQETFRSLWFTCWPMSWIWKNAYCQIAILLINVFQQDSLHLLVASTFLSQSWSQPLSLFSTFKKCCGLQTATEKSLKQSVKLLRNQILLLFCCGIFVFSSTRKITLSIYQIYGPQYITI